MNDRPLTYVSTSCSDPEPLTPSHLLHGRRLTALPFSNSTSDQQPVTSRKSIRTRSYHTTVLEAMESRIPNCLAGVPREQGCQQADNSNRGRGADPRWFHQPDTMGDGRGRFLSDRPWREDEGGGNSYTEWTFDSTDSENISVRDHKWQLNLETQREVIKIRLALRETILSSVCDDTWMISFVQES